MLWLDATIISNIIRKFRFTGNLNHYSECLNSYAVNHVIELIIFAFFEIIDSQGISVCENNG